MKIEARDGELYILSDNDYELVLRHNPETDEMSITIGPAQGSGIDFFTDFGIVAGWIEKEKERD